MRGVFSVALQSMQHDLKRVDIVATNLANALTPGYKRDLIVERPFSDLLESPSSELGRVDRNVAALQTYTDNRTGVFKTTEQSLDVAIGGSGFFQIQAGEQLGYTRQGNFHLDARGRLVTADGFPVLSKSGEIILKDAHPDIDEMGNIRYAESLQGKSTGDVLAQIRVLEFKDWSSLEKAGNGIYFARENAEFSDAKLPHLRQGQLENSNVNSMSEMVQLMQTMRHFESMQRATQAYDEMLSTSIKKLGDLS